MKIFIATGEVSGDIQGAILAKELRALDKKISIAGFGGHAMQEAGVENIEDMSTMSTMGILEGANPIFAFKKLGAFSKLKEYLKNNKIDLMVLVDNQGVNLILAKYCKKNNIPYVYYFPPHVGVWGAWNAKKLRSCRRVITQFHFDYDVYKKYNCNVIFSGHPFADLKEINPPKLDLAQKKYTVGVLFGSRFQEINTLAPVFIKSMKMMHDMLSGDIRFVIPIAYPEYRNAIQAIMKKHENLLSGLTYTFLEGRETEYVYSYSDMLILSSGTSSLIAACYKKPMVICYKISLPTFIIGKMFVRGGFIGMPNIISGKSVAPELLQGECNRDAIVSHAMRYLTDKAYYAETVENLSKVRESLGEQGVVARVAKEIITAALE